MAKSKEELDALKAKIKELKNELGALSEEELKQVAGGDGETDCKERTCPRCGSHNVITYEIEHSCLDCGFIW